MNGPNNRPEIIVSPVYLENFLHQLFTLAPGAHASERTITKYRRLAGCPGVSKTDREHAELLMTGLLYRPKTVLMLKLMHRKHEAEIAQLFRQIALDCDISIANAVKGSELKTVIFVATGIQLKSDRTLRDYAAMLSAQTQQNIYFDRNAIYPPAVASAFARLALKRKLSKVEGGRKGAESRWAATAA